MRYAKGRAKHVPGQMNKTEESYASHLKLLKMAGDIEDYWFEGIKIKLAPATFYTPDFLVFAKDGTLECHEVKGHWEDDARVKIKVASDKFPFKFVAMKPKAKRDGGGWEREDFE